MNSTIKTVVFWLVVAAAALLLWQFVRSSPTQRAEQRTPEISYSQFMSSVEAGDVARVSITGSRIQGEYHGGKGMFRLVGPSNPGIYLDVLRSRGVEIWFKETSGDAGTMQLLGTWGPLILLGALWFYMIRQMQRRSAGPPERGTSGPTGLPM
jgi:cell division protease FtsH